MHDMLIDLTKRYMENFFMNLTEEMGRRIRRAREEKKWSRRVLAEKTINISISSISNYEHGRRRPGIEEAKQLAEALELSVLYILCLEEESELKPDEKALLDNYRATDRRGKDVIISIAKTQPAKDSDRIEPLKKAK